MYREETQLWITDSVFVRLFRLSSFYFKSIECVFASISNDQVPMSNDQSNYAFQC